LLLLPLLGLLPLLLLLLAACCRPVVVPLAYI